MPLLDWSIEKSALTDSNLGREVYFGGFRSQCTGKIFSKLFQIERTPTARRVVPFYWRSIQKQLEIVLKETRPDVMYTHIIFSAKMVSEFGIPFVYDDYEYWPIYFKRQSEISKHNQQNTRASSPARKFLQEFLISKAVYTFD
jgi:hypothetical protein